MNEIAVFAAAFVAGFALGVAAEWRILRPWVELALRQARALHRPLVRSTFRGGPDDGPERGRRGRRS